METINHECYVSLEVAKLLKEAGFDWETFSHWVESDINNPDFKFSGLSDKPILYDGYTPIDEDTCVGRKKDWNNYNDECPLICNYSAPTLAVAQRWLREVKGLLLGMAVHDNALNYAWEYTISRIEHVNLDGRDLSLIGWLCDNYDETENIIHHGKKFVPYEETLESGIKKALEMILEKGK